MLEVTTGPSLPSPVVRHAGRCGVGASDRVYLSALIKSRQAVYDTDVSMHASAGASPLAWKDHDLFPESTLPAWDWTGLALCTYRQRPPSRCSPGWRLACTEAEEANAQAARGAACGGCPQAAH